MIRCVVFDLDGTLADTSADLAAAMNHVLREFGRPEKPADLLTSYVGDGLEVYLGRALETDEQPLIARAKPVFLDYYRDHLVDATRLYPGVRETLDWLRKNRIVCYILSNKPEEFIRPIAGRLGIAGDFADSFGQYRFPRTKPDPEGLLHIMRTGGFTADETLIVGDHHTDIETGRNAGVRSVFCAFGLGRTGASVPDFTIASMSELAGIVASLGLPG
jgi:phosphoglycolate phosphatase